MEKSAINAPTIVDAREFNLQDYAGRDVVVVRENANQRTLQELNFFGIRLSASVDDSPAVAGVLGGGFLGWELLTTRNTVGKMLMTDDQFADTFRGGALKDIHDKYITEFSRYYGRESGWTQMITDPVNRFKMQWKVGNEVKARGVGFMEAVRAWRPRHWMTVLGGAGALYWSLSATAKDARAGAQPQPQLDATSADIHQVLRAVGHELPQR